MQKPLHVLIVEDSEDDACLIAREFERGGYCVASERVDTPSAMQAALSRAAWDVIVSDYAMPQFSGPAALKVLQESGLDVPFIIVSGAIGEDLAVEAMRGGARDYVMKDKLTRLVPAVERELCEAGIRRQQRQTELNLRHAERLAALGTFAAGIAHEINNPLAAIQMTARYGLKSPQLLPELQTIFNEIIEDAERCTRIVASVLQFARKGPAPKTRISLADVLRVSCEQARRYAGERGVRVHLRLPDAPPYIVANETEMEQVFINLITNATQASQPRQVVTVRAERDGQQARICVEDHGRGMTEDLRARAFDAFFTTRADEGGTGLGLSMAHDIVSEHGGCIRIDSQVGQGTTVTVELPCASPAAGGESA